MKILYGMTGSVATRLAPKLIDQLILAGHEVRVVATERSLTFLPAESVIEEQNKTMLLTEHASVEVLRDKAEWPVGSYWQKGDPVPHIEEKDWADLCLIAPLSADTLADIWCGKADKFLTSIARAWHKGPESKPFLVAPAMNTDMWNDPITEQQLLDLATRFGNFHVIEPIEAQLACGVNGVGAMARVETIIETVNRFGSK